MEKSSDKKEIEINKKIDNKSAENYELEMIAQSDSLDKSQQKHFKSNNVDSEESENDDEELLVTDPKKTQHEIEDIQETNQIFNNVEEFEYRTVASKKYTVQELADNIISEKILEQQGEKEEVLTLNQVNILDAGDVSIQNRLVVGSRGSALNKQNTNQENISGLNEDKALINDSGENTGDTQQSETTDDSSDTQESDAQENNEAEESSDVDSENSNDTQESNEFNNANTNSDVNSAGIANNGFVLTDDFIEVLNALEEAEAEESESEIIEEAEAEEEIEIVEEVNDPILGSEASDVITGTIDADVIEGRAGNDVISGGAGNDDIKGEAGDDQLHGDEGNDIISGGEGSDSLYGGAGDDQLYGGVGDDILEGGAGNDAIYAGEGNDNIIAGAGNDFVSGGSGDDSLFMTNPLNQYSFSYNADNSTLEITDKVTGTKDTIQDVENFDFNGATYNIDDLITLSGGTPILSNSNNFIVNNDMSFSVKLDSLIAHSDSSDALGHYFKDSAGNIIEGMIDMINVGDSLGDGGLTSLVYDQSNIPADAVEMGFFIVENGANLDPNLTNGSQVSFQQVDGVLKLVAPVGEGGSDVVFDSNLSFTESTFNQGSNEIEINDKDNIILRFEDTTISGGQTTIFSDVITSLKVEVLNETALNVKPPQLDNGTLDITNSTEFAISYDSISSQPDFANSFGYYFADSNDEPISGKVMYANVKDNLGQDPVTINYGGDSGLDIPANATSIGFFIIPNGGVENPGLPDNADVTFQEGTFGNWYAKYNDASLDGFSGPGGSSAFFSHIDLNSDSAEHMAFSGEGEYVFGFQDFDGGSNFDGLLLSTEIERYDSSQNQELTGSDGDDRFIASDNGSIIRPLDGSDVIYGGDGVDNIIFEGNAAEYTISYNDDNIQVTSNSGDHNADVIIYDIDSDDNLLFADTTIVPYSG